MIPIKGDITSQASLLKVVETVKRRSGFIDVLINNAGISANPFKGWGPGDDIKSFQERLWNSGSPEDFTRTFETNVTSVYYTTIAFLELLHFGNERRSPGMPSSQVVIMSSGAAFRKDDKVFSLSYGLSKAAVTQLGKSLANILAPCKIRSNVIAPGIFPSGIQKDFNLLFRGAYS